MRYSVVFLISIIFLATGLYSKQLSAFGAGNLNSSTPYGLSSDEKAIYANKKEIRSVRIQTFLLKNKISSLRERIDGLQTVVEGISQISNQNKLLLKYLSKNVQSLRANISESISDINQSLSKISTLLNIINNQYATKDMLMGVTDKFNKQYVTREEFNKLVTGLNVFKALVLKTLKHIYRKNDNQFSIRSNAILYKKAYSFYIHKKYNMANKYYKYLIKKSYMPATSNFMLGEISYKRFKFGKAIAYYKQSALLYNKSKFMPTLLLHTAISMRKTRDIIHARKFFNALIAKYPRTIEANKARKLLMLK